MRVVIGEFEPNEANLRRQPLIGPAARTPAESRRRPIRRARRVAASWPGPSSRTAGDWDGEGGIGDPSLIFVTHRSLRKEGPMRGRPPLRKKGAYTAAERMRRYRQRRKTIATIGKDRRQAAAADGTRGRPRRGDAQSGPGARRRALWRPLHRSAVGLPRLLTRHRHESPRRQPLPGDASFRRSTLFFVVSATARQNRRSLVCRAEARLCPHRVHGHAGTTV